MNFFDRINAWMDRSEVSWVTLLTKFLPIMVPLIPAIQTKNHVVTVLGYDAWQGWVAAAIVEFFGYASMYKMMQFAFKKAGFWMVTFAIVIYLFYLGVIIAFNVLPEIKAGKESYIIWMNSLFALLSVPASALTAISAIHTERSETERAERERLNAERKAERERQRAEREQRKSEQRTDPNEQTRTNRPERAKPNERANTPADERTPVPDPEHRTNRAHRTGSPNTGSRTEPNAQPSGDTATTPNRRRNRCRLVNLYDQRSLEKVKESYGRETEHPPNIPPGRSRPHAGTEETPDARTVV